MTSKVLFRNMANKLIFADSYYGNARLGDLVGESYNAIDIRGTDPCITYQSHKKYTLERADFTHLLIDTSDLASATVAADSRSLDAPSTISIDGAELWTGDRVEVRKAQATALSLSPGEWTAESPSRLILTNPPSYTATSTGNFGYPWRYRVDTNGDLVGLARASPTNQSFAQTQTSAPVKSLSSLLDSNLFGTFADFSSASFQGVNASFDQINNVRRIAMVTNSRRQSYDRFFPVASFGFNTNNGTLVGSMYNVETKTLGGKPWSYGSTIAYATNTINLNVNKVGINDEGNSRAYVSVELCVDAPCQIWINGETPTNGSKLFIPESVAEDFFPAISSGEYVIVENSGSEQWRIQRAQP